MRIDRSVAAGLNRAALQAESSLLLLPWRGRRDVLTALLGASYSEIVAATSVPVAIAAIHTGTDPTRRRIVLLARDDDLVPGHRP